MYYILRIIFLLFLILYGRGKSSLFKMLVCLQVISFVTEYMMDAYLIKTDDIVTYIYVLFCEVILLLINMPWAKVSIKRIVVKDWKYQKYFEQTLIPVLSGVFLVNLILAAIIMYMIPDVSDYKLKDGWKELYETIPMYAFLARFSYVTQFIGYFAVPISFYYFSINNNRRGSLFLFLSSSSLMAGIAAYSRAQMLVYSLCLLANYFLYQDVFPKEKKKIIQKYAIRALVVLVAVFLYTTINRFTSDNMEFYGDRIPKTSMVQDPLLYSFMDYTGQGFPNGINQLVNYTPSKNFHGQDALYYPLLFLDYFGVIEWDAEAAQENREKVFGFDGGNFHGYACALVFDFGFFITIFWAIFYFSYIRRKVSMTSNVSIINSLFLSYLVLEPTNSIFYSSLGAFVFPFLFYILVRFLYNFRLLISPQGIQYLEKYTTD